MTLSSDPQPAKAPLPSDSTEPSETRDREVQSRNAAGPTEATEDGSSTDVSPEQPRNAASPIEVTVYPFITDGISSSVTVPSSHL